MAFIVKNGVQQLIRRGIRPSSMIRKTGMLRNNILLTQLPRTVYSSSQNKATAGGIPTLSATEKTPYEIELEKLQKENKEEGFGFLDDDPVMDKIFFHTMMFLSFSVFLTVGFGLFCFQPHYKEKDRAWKFREARWKIAERRAKGEPLISQDYAPAEIVEQMVPPPGEWEREWLEKQPTTRPICTDWFGQNQTIV